MAGENQTIAIMLNVPGQTVERQKQLYKALEEAGLGNPKGRLYHVGCSEEDGAVIMEVWESDELRNQFVRKLEPVLQKLGLPSAEPQIYSVHTIM